MKLPPVKFTTKKDRDTLVTRLANLGNAMHRCWDQGADGSLRPTEEQADDVLAAAAIVALTPTEEDEQS